MQSFVREQAALVRSVEKSAGDLADFTKLDMGKYRVSLKPRFDKNINDFLVQVNYKQRKININTEKYNQILKEAKSFGAGEQFAALAVKNVLAKTVTRSLFRNVFGSDAEEILQLAKREKSGKGEESKEQRRIKIVEEDATSLALLKILNIISLYEDSDKQKSWDAFSERAAATLLTRTMGLINKSGKEKVSVASIGEDVGFAQETYARDGNFYEYTLKFIDRMTDNGGDETAQKEFLNEIIAAALLNAFSKSDLEKETEVFFRELRFKADLMAMVREERYMEERYPFGLAPGELKAPRALSAFREGEA